MGRTNKTSGVNTKPEGVRPDLSSPRPLSELLEFVELSETIGDLKMIRTAKVLDGCDGRNRTALQLDETFLVAKEAFLRQFIKEHPAFRHRLCTFGAN